jgi:hypothetical protein
VPFDVEWLPDDRVVVVRGSGVVVDRDFVQSFTEFTALAREHGDVAALLDLTGVETSGPPIGRVFEMAMAKVSMEGVLLRRQAMVVLPELADFATFWENANVNRGLRSRVFGDLEPALAWLGEDRA